MSTPAQQGYANVAAIRERITSAIAGRGPGYWIEVRAKRHEWESLQSWLAEYGIWDIHQALASASGMHTDGLNWRAMVGTLLSQKLQAEEKEAALREENRLLRRELSKSRLRRGLDETYCARCDLFTTSPCVLCGGEVTTIREMGENARRT